MDRSARLTRRTALTAAPGLVAPGFIAPGFIAPGFIAPGFFASGFFVSGFFAPTFTAQARAATPAIPDALVTVTVRTDAPGRSDPLPALRRALGIALARLSGNPAMEERADGRDPAPLILDRSYEDVLLDKPLNDEQGTRDRPHLLTIRFDAEALLRLLHDLGERPWLAPRPRIAPMLTLGFREGRETRLTGDDPLVDRPRAALTAAAARYAVPVALPILAAPAVPRGAVPVEGRLDWVDAEFGWRAAFTLRGETWATTGVSLDEAFRVLVGGAALRLRDRA